MKQIIVLLLLAVSAQASASSLTQDFKSLLPYPEDTYVRTLPAVVPSLTQVEIANIGIELNNYFTNQDFFFYQIYELDNTQAVSFSSCLDNIYKATSTSSHIADSFLNIFADGKDSVAQNLFEKAFCSWDTKKVYIIEMSDGGVMALYGLIAINQTHNGFKEFRLVIRED